MESAKFLAILSQNCYNWQLEKITYFDTQKYREKMTYTHFPPVEKTLWFYSLFSRFLFKNVIKLETGFL